MGRLDGKVALISGGARGMGAAHAHGFVAEGARVVVADVLDDEGKMLAEDLGDAAMFTHLDVTDEASWAEAIRATETHFRKLDVLVNNAGVLSIAPLEQTTVADFRRMMEVNQLGVFLGMKAAAAAMRRAGGGSIVNISSVEGLRAGAGTVAYASTKFAVTGMTKVAALELGPSIRVNSVHPGGIDTPMVRGQGLEGVDLNKIFKRIPAGRAGRPGEVTGAVVFLASDDAGYVTGAEIVVDGGATAYIGWGGPYPR